MATMALRCQVGPALYKGVEEYNHINSRVCHKQFNVLCHCHVGKKLRIFIPRYVRPTHSTHISSDGSDKEEFLLWDREISLQNISELCSFFHPNGHCNPHARHIASVKECKTDSHTGIALCYIEGSYIQFHQIHHHSPFCDYVCTICRYTYDRWHRRMWTSCSLESYQHQINIPLSAPILSHTDQQSHTNHRMAATHPRTCFQRCCHGTFPQNFNMIITTICFIRLISVVEISLVFIDYVLTNIVNMLVGYT